MARLTLKWFDQIQDSRRWEKKTKKTNAKPRLDSARHADVMVITVSVATYIFKWNCQCCDALYTSVVANYTKILLHHKMVIISTNITIPLFFMPGNMVWCHTSLMPFKKPVKGLFVFVFCFFFDCVYLGFFESSSMLVNNATISQIGFGAAAQRKAYIVSCCF